MVKRFLMLPLFFPKTIQRAIDRKVNYTCYDETGKVINKVVDDKPFFTPVDDVLPKVEPRIDTLADTSVTVNKPAPFIEDKEVEPEPVKTEYGKLEKMGDSGIKMYCSGCKIKTDIINPVFTTYQTRRGIKKSARGTCSICNKSVYSLVKA